MGTNATIGQPLNCNPDALVWADEFVARAKNDPSIATDHAVMTAWFANAIMCGFDVHRWRSKEYKRSVRRALYPWFSLKRYFTPLSSVGK